MKKQLYLTSRIALSMFVVLTFGCGGGGGGSGGGASGAASEQSLASQSASGKSIQLAESNRTPQVIEFAATGNSFTQYVSTTREVVKSGTYGYTTSGRSTTVSLVDSANSEVTTINLAFETTTTGTFSSTSSTGVIGSGTFSNFAASGASGSPPVGGSGSGGDGGNSGSVNPGSGGGGTNPPPNGAGGLDGKVMTLTRSTGQTHTYTFTGTRFTDADPPEEGSGIYTYSRSGAQTSLTLNYTGSTAPVNLAGDRHDLQLSFKDETKGTFNGTYITNDGAALPQEGVFEFIR